jgi:hypothetical protein
MSTSKTKVRRRWVTVAPGHRVLPPIPAAAAAHRERMARERAMERRIQADTCGLGHWERPEG